ncbi:MAG: hypothetical protein BRD45_04635 [Bacteroidetes bacterium QS_8_64_10]|nr:MAG: hypothetical protein BRD45_04635 [Bacteroidetes bacterium QS_8_64_10]
MKRLIVLLSLTLVAVLGGCDLAGDSDEPVDDAPDYGEIDDVSFTEHVQPLLQEHFAELETEPGLRLDSWQRLFEGSENGAVVIPFDAEHSVLYQLATRDSLLSAAGGQPLSGEETAFLQRWIEAGAQNDAGEMPFAEARDLVYVCNQSAGVISVIAPSANVVARHIDLSDPDYGFVGEDASGQSSAGSACWRARMRSWAPLRSSRQGCWRGTRRGICSWRATRRACRTCRPLLLPSALPI